LHFSTVQEKAEFRPFVAMIFAKIATHSSAWGRGDTDSCMLEDFARAASLAGRRISPQRVIRTAPALKLDD
jgi:hypothetical protein